MRRGRDPSLVLLVASAAAAGFLWRAALEPDRLRPVLLAPPAEATDVVSSIPDFVARVSARTGGPSRASARPPAAGRRVTEVRRVRERAEPRLAARPARRRPEPTPTPDVPSPAPKPQQPKPTPTAPTPQPEPPAPKPDPPALPPQQPPSAPAPEPAPEPAPAPPPAAAPPQAAAPAPAPASTSERPGWGKGDRNHDHTGPPGDK